MPIQGRSIKRPLFKQLLEDIKKKNKDFDAIIVWRCDRLIRNTSNYHALIKPQFDRADIAILSATENNDINNPYGRYMRNTQINNAELESDINSIRTIANLREKCLQGNSPVAKPPIGYKRVNGKIIIDESVAFYVKQILIEHSTGLYSDRQLARKMRDAGFSKCTKKMVENITRKHLLFYTGNFTFSLKNEWGVPIKEEYKGNHEPLISMDLYYKILKLHNNTNVHKPKTQKHDFLYKGLIFCPKINKYLTGETQKGSNKSGEYGYYRCHKAIPGDEHCKKCKKCIKAEIIDKAVLDILKEFELTPAKFEEVKEYFKIFLNIQTEYDEKRKQEIDIKIKKLKNRLNKIYEDKLDRLIDEETYLEKKEKYSIELHDLTTEYSALSKTNQVLIEKIEKVFELCKNLPQRYFELSNDKKRKLLNLLCSNFFYENSKLEIKVKSAFLTLFRTFVFSSDLPDFTQNLVNFENGAGNEI